MSDEYYPIANDEFLRRWSAAGARHSTLQEVVAVLRTKAADAFGEGRDKEAKMTRSLAAEIDALRASVSVALQGFISEDERRRS